jgi:glycosyltransferase involved in cell wall biosynthesis
MLEITDKGDLAVLYKTKDINDLLNKFNDFLHNKEIYKQRAKNNAQKVMKLYSIENHISELTKAYSSLFSTIPQLNN